MHITLAGPYKSIDKYFINSFKTFAKGKSSIILNSNDYGYKNDFYESFFISIEYSKNLKKIRKEIYQFSPFDIYKNYNPHISLAYGDHSLGKKDEIYLSIQKPIERITMDKILLVDVNENIFKWKTLESFDLK